MRGSLSSGIKAMRRNTGWPAGGQEKGSAMAPIALMDSSALSDHVSTAILNLQHPADPPTDYRHISKLRQV